MKKPGHPAPLDVEEGNPARVLRAAVEALHRGQRAALAAVLETEGSTYTRAGTLALFTDNGHVGWLSGGCLEPEIERRAMQAVDQSALEWMEIDTRDDDALFSGNAVGCRGRQRVVLLPLPALARLEPLLKAWLNGDGTLELTVQTDGVITCQFADVRIRLQVHGSPPDWTGRPEAWTLRWRRPPRVLIYGAGPEAVPLQPLLEGLGWSVSISEPRATWRARVPDASFTEEALTRLRPDAALVMHHNFERDLEALQLLAVSTVPFIGLLGPERRREDLFQVMPESLRILLLPRLRSPIGMPLGGRGPEAIALSIAAQLQAWRHGVHADLQ